MRGSPSRKSSSFPTTRCRLTELLVMGDVHNKCYLARENEASCVEQDIQCLWRCMGRWRCGQPSQRVRFHSPGHNHRIPIVTRGTLRCFRRLTKTEFMLAGDHQTTDRHRYCLANWILALLVQSRPGRQSESPHARFQLSNFCSDGILQIRFGAELCDEAPSAYEYCFQLRPRFHRKIIPINTPEHFIICCRERPPHYSPETH